jgi:hypothetical protein
MLTPRNLSKRAQEESDRLVRRNHQPDRGNETDRGGLTSTVRTREAPMKMTKIALAGFAATLISSAALAQQPQTGTVTQINRISGTIAIQQAEGGTVGASSGAAAQEFKVQGSLLDTLHAGDKVTFSATGTSGTRTITKLEKQ